ncbi:4-oxalomesaconate tautomerase [Tropicimonas marinistellae]|uniref:4-oxalomesaconate tautomerase n=1 Tax=Tropicimonas marinistellae TaxID=1739787 RepID=UPI0008324AE3|nr:4-oxalomesaconate tautomerase [Tropicimonas marinistellae]
MSQTAIPYWFLRGGTSRGPYFRRRDLPDDRDTLAKVLVSVIGAGNPLNIDGIGGGNAVTTKVAILSRSTDAEADVDYFFAQVAVEEALVDFGPTCGNILVGVGPAAIEMGLVEARDGKTPVRIRAVNTGALIEAIVETPERRVTYEGNIAVDGVPGRAAPITLNFLGVVGSKTGAMLPTGNLKETINGIDVTCMDVAMPMVIARAEDFGVTGGESQVELDGNGPLFEKMEPLRREAGRRMGLGEVSKSVTPKIGLISKPVAGGHFRARYFMPWACHPTLAITGSQCLAACALCPGTVAEGIAEPIARSPAVVRIENPVGMTEVTVDYRCVGGALDFRSAGVIRTARLIARGEVFVPDAALAREPGSGGLA